MSIGAKTENQSRIRSSKAVKKIKLGIITIVCVVLFLLAIFITLSFLKGGSMDCQEGEYFDKGKNRCLSCSIGCLRCESGKDNQCYSCVGSMYKILKDYDD